MDVLDNVPRVTRPSATEMLERHFKQLQPVVITDLYADDELARVKTRDDAIATWGDLVLPVQLEYTTQAMTGEKRRIHLMKLRDFLALPDTDPLRVKRVITEQETPPEIRSMFRPPPYVELGGVPQDDVITKTFLAHAGHYAHLHYDIDGRHVLLTQIFGRKRVMVVPPDRNQMLDPFIEERGGNMSGRFVENLSPEEKLAFAREVGAYDTIIGPGESIFIPTAWWHYIDYVDAAMSINFRFGRTPLQQDLLRVSDGLSSRHLHYWQTITQPFVTGAPPSPFEAEAWEVVRLYDRARAGGPDEIAAFGRAVEALYRRIYPAGYTRTLRSNDAPRRLPITDLWTRELEAWEKPAPPERGPWTAELVPVLEAKMEPVVALGTDALMVLQDGAAIWKIDSADGDALRVLRALFTSLVTTPGLSIGAIAEQIGCPADELVDLVEELAETGCLVDARPILPAAAAAPTADAAATA